MMSVPAKRVGLNLTGYRPYKPVADAVFSNDDARRFGVVLDFLPEVLDMHPQQVPGVDVSIPPDLGEQALMG